MTERITPTPSTRSAGSDPVMVPTRLIQLEWPPNPGLEPGDEYFDGIFDSIQQEGIKNPLHITTQWRVIDGAHRLCAARILGIERVPVRFWTGVEWLP